MDCIHIFPCYFHSKILTSTSAPLKDCLCNAIVASFIKFEMVKWKRRDHESLAKLCLSFVLPPCSATTCYTAAATRSRIIFSTPPVRSYCTSLTLCTVCPRSELLSAVASATTCYTAAATRSRIIFSTPPVRSYCTSLTLCTVCPGSELLSAVPIKGTTPISTLYSCCRVGEWCFY